MRYLRKRFIPCYIYLIAGINFAVVSFLTADEILMVMCASGSVLCICLGILLFIIKSQHTMGILPEDVVYYEPDYKAKCDSAFKLHIPKADNLTIGCAYIVEDVEGYLLRLKGCKYYHHVSQFAKSPWHYDH